MGKLSIVDLKVLRWMADVQKPMDMHTCPACGRYVDGKRPHERPGLGAWCWWMSEKAEASRRKYMLRYRKEG